MQSSEVVIFSSQALRNDSVSLDPELARRSVLVRNAVDADRFAAAPINAGWVATAILAQQTPR